MHKKEESLIPALSIRGKCGTCLHYQRLAHPEARKTCDKLGTLASGAACSNYNADWTHVLGVTDEQLEVLTQLARSATAQEIQMLAYGVRAIEFQRKSRWVMGDAVWFCIGAEYLNNYFRGVVLSVDLKGEFVYVSSALTKDSDKTLITLMLDSALTEEQFRKRRRHLTKEGRVEEPRGRSGRPTLFEELQMPKPEWREYRNSLATKPDEYVPPTLDSVPQHWLDRRQVQSFKEDAKTLAAIKKTAAAAQKKAKSSGVVNGKFRINRG